MDVTYVSHVCYMCFYLDVAYVFVMIFECLFVFTSVSSILFYILQVLHLDVSKVDMVLHM
jgi:hypothetical protein